MKVAAITGHKDLKVLKMTMLTTILVLWSTSERKPNKAPPMPVSGVMFVFLRVSECEEEPRHGGKNEPHQDWRSTQTCQRVCKEDLQGL